MPLLWRRSCRARAWTTLAILEWPYRILEMHEWRREGWCNRKTGHLPGFGVLREMSDVPQVHEAGNIF